jgi:hypothetical protein
MMTNAEHLIENAVTALESHDPYDAYSIFMYNPCNAEMAALAGVSLDVVWEMAQYCYTTLRQDWKEKWEKEAERWIPVTERLPEARVDVLVATPKRGGGNRVRVGWYSDVTESWHVGEFDTQEKVTHWKPMPDAPKEGHREED